LTGIKFERSSGLIGMKNVTESRFFRAKQSEAEFIPIPNSSEEIEFLCSTIDVRNELLTDSRTEVIMRALCRPRYDGRICDFLTILLVVPRIFGEFVANGDHQIFNSCCAFARIFEFGEDCQRRGSWLEGPIFKASCDRNNKCPLTLNEGPSLNSGYESQNTRKQEYAERKPDHSIWMSERVTTKPGKRAFILVSTGLLSFASLIVLFGRHTSPRRQLVGVMFVGAPITLLVALLGMEALDCFADFAPRNSDVP
jgi:hypothetical protein